MAKPIKETPILRGKAAKAFIEKTNEVRKISEEKRQEIRNGFNTLNAITKQEEF